MRYDSVQETRVRDVCADRESQRTACIRSSASTTTELKCRAIKLVNTAISSLHGKTKAAAFHDSICFESEAECHASLSLAEKPKATNSHLLEQFPEGHLVLLLLLFTLTLPLLFFFTLPTLLLLFLFLVDLLELARVLVEDLLLVVGAKLER